MITDHGAVGVRPSDCAAHLTGAIALAGIAEGARREP